MKLVSLMISSLPFLNITLLADSINDDSCQRILEAWASERIYYKPNSLNQNEWNGVFADKGNGPFGTKTDAHLASRKVTERERSSQKFGHGLMVNLLPGEKVESVTPGRPNSGFDPFVQAILRQVGIALGLPYEVLVQHFQSSYSASRAALLEAWKFFKLRRAWLVRMLCQPVYEWMIHEAISAGMLDAPGFEDQFKQRIYLSAEWIGASMQSIDPLKDAKADEVRLNSGVASRRSIVEEQGRDFEKLKRELVGEIDTTQG